MYFRVLSLRRKEISPSDLKTRRDNERFYCRSPQLNLTETLFKWFLFLYFTIGWSKLANSATETISWRERQKLMTESDFYFVRLGRPL